MKISTQREMYSCKHPCFKKERSHISHHTFHLKGKKGGNWGEKKGKTKLKATERGNNKDWRREN